MACPYDAYPSETLGRVSAQARGELPTRVMEKEGEKVRVYDSLSALDKLARAHGLHAETLITAPNRSLIGGFGGAEAEAPG